MTNRLFLAATATVLAVGGVFGAGAPVAPVAPVGAKGAAGVGDPLLPLSGDGGLHVRHYALTLAYQPRTQKLDGTAVLSATATQDLSAFDLDLAGLDVRRVTVDGQAVGYDRNGPKLEISLGQTLANGADFKIAVEYGGTPHAITDADGAPDGWTAARGPAPSWPASRRAR